MTDLRKMTYGVEIEWGDVNRRLTIDPNLGAWEFSERDIYNSRDPHRFVAADPLGLNPPYGGEINIYPSQFPVQIADRVSRLKRFFTEAGCPPTVPCTTHLHVHVRVPGLRDDMVRLKRLTRWVMANQAEVVKVCGQFQDSPEIALGLAKNYMKLDGGRLMPGWLGDNLLTATDFDDYIRIYCCGKDAVSRGRPFRYAINLYALKHIDTIEFRMFRGTMDPVEVLSAVNLAGDCITEALTTGRPFNEVFASAPYKLPPFVFDLEGWRGHQATKWDDKRGKKVRTFHDV